MVVNLVHEKNTQRVSLYVCSGEYQACLFAARCGSYLALYLGSCMGMRLTAYVTDACLTLEI